jgi:uridylate kinase
VAWSSRVPLATDGSVRDRGLGGAAPQERRYNVAVVSTSKSARVKLTRDVPRRIVLKISGESMGDGGGRGIDMEEIRKIAASCAHIHQKMGKELAVVVGGGNLLRGAGLASSGMDRATADYMGMLATLINALALQDALEQMEVPTRVLSAVSTHQCAEPFIRRRAIRHLEKGRIVILAGGTGNPYFTTDTCAALRAHELQAGVLLKATKVDGVYSADPNLDPAAVRYKHLTYREVLEKQLKVMDATAITMAMEHSLPILVFDFKRPNNFERAVQGDEVGTLISDAPDSESPQ